MPALVTMPQGKELQIQNQIIFFNPQGAKQRVGSVERGKSEDEGSGEPSIEIPVYNSLVPSI